MGYTASLDVWWIADGVVLIINERYGSWAECIMQLQLWSTQRSAGRLLLLVVVLCVGGLESLCVCVCVWRRTNEWDSISHRCPALLTPCRHDMTWHDPVVFAARCRVAPYRCAPFSYMHPLCNFFADNQSGGVQEHIKRLLPVLH